MKLADQPLWCALAWVLIGSLAVWSYGTNNVAIPGVPIPLVDVLLVGLVIHSRRWWRPFTVRGTGRSLLWLIVALNGAVAVRVAVDYPQYGIQAVRGALFALEIWGVFVGVALARRLGRATVVRTLSIIFGVALTWFLLYPLRDYILSFSPVVGVQRPALLFSFTSMGLIAAWALFWFGLRPSPRAIAAAAAAAAAVLFAQSRGMFAGILLASLAVLLLSRGERRRRLVKRVLAAMAAVLLVFSLLPPLPGRLGEVSLDTMRDLVATGLGQQGDVSSSFEDRGDWNEATINAIRTERLGWFVGVGLGADLTDGFSTSGRAVVNPHNDFLEFYARLGVFVLPWFLCWIVALRAFWRHARSGDALAIWATAAFAMMLLGSLTQPFNSFAYGGMLWWLIAGLMLGTITNDDHRQATSVSAAGLVTQPT